MSSDKLTPASITITVAGMTNEPPVEIKRSLSSLSLPKAEIRRYCIAQIDAMARTIPEVAKMYHGHKDLFEREGCNGG